MYRPFQFATGDEVGDSIAAHRTLEKTWCTTHAEALGHVYCLVRKWHRWSLLRELHNCNNCVEIPLERGVVEERFYAGEFSSAYLATLQYATRSRWLAFYTVMLRIMLLRSIHEGREIVVLPCHGSQPALLDEDLCTLRRCVASVEITDVVDAALVRVGLDQCGVLDWSESMDTYMGQGDGEMQRIEHVWENL